MPNPPLAIGTYGAINTKRQPNGSWRASARFRDDDGTTRPVQAYGPTKARAVAALKDRLKERRRASSAGAELTLDTKLCDLADMWLAELEFENRATPQTIDDYRSHIYVANKRGRKDTVKINTSLGGLRIREATTTRLDAHLREVARTWPSKARAHKVVLKGMMGFAVRRDVITHNPLLNVARIPRNAQRPRAADLPTLHALREQLETWLTGSAIAGTPAYQRGPRRSRIVLDVADVLLGTGARIGEALAIRWQDLDLDAEVPRLTICGTIVRVTQEDGVLRAVRQEWTKTQAGYRSVALPQFVVETLRRRATTAISNPLDLVFTGRGGAIYDPHNFRRSWRAARGETFNWVTPKTFRKSVATLIANEYGPSRAARQLGHADDGTIAQRHYIDTPHEVEDFRVLLSRSSR
ncbi:tyrosine-type recombinase/integrase [Nocardia rosealba]|uniref:tyrosine-type recombinase/integrase n=1 Tax=Nocardia rosealba TaxID=2878563 RepID=UPI001CD9843F|nr:tyrosine-type recombinase/integrase [Nocardia rosealba]MCA2208627.1 tyrosine-type recombinase/integrase [Nocardia rosealba]